MLGIIPGWGGTQRLPRLLGRGRAPELLLSGNQIDAARALELGLVNRVVEPAQLHPTARDLAQELIQFDRVFRSQDALEGFSAFLQKRTAEWSGR
ncbi:MAG TPA: enoyl-CoA hydratase-related protein [Candidatus Dormibacteraeota bacterium]|nr:enoyl-CoA hydratase-related protein [Candidatus Dormibacteraeota bacterium]